MNKYLKSAKKANFYKQKFAELLPEVYKRKLHLKKNYKSIYEFAKDLAGMNEEEVRKAMKNN